MASTKDHGIDKETVLDAPAAAAPSSSATDYGVESSSEGALDDNYEVFKATQETDFDEAEVKRVLRKIDLRIVPVLFVTYFLQYLDKSKSPRSRAASGARFFAVNPFPPLAARD